MFFRNVYAKEIPVCLSVSVCVYFFEPCMVRTGPNLKHELINLGNDYQGVWKRQKKKHFGQKILGATDLNLVMYVQLDPGSNIG